MSLDAFHPAVAGWFRSRFAAPTPAQEHAWPALLGSRHVLVAAPTGSGKTLAAFLCALDGLTREALRGGLPDETRVLYVSPLKALSADVALNLEQPLAGLRAELARLGLPDAPLRVGLRTGDTQAKDRLATLKRPPHVLVTTPESLFILITSEGGRRLLSTVRTVIIDEIHAVAATKRGAHLALTLERVERVAGRSLQRIGLSATQRPLEAVARLLVGTQARNAEGVPDCAIVDAGHARDLDLALEVGPTPLAPVMSGEAWTEIHDRLSALIAEHRTTLVFVNTRRLSERLARHLSERLGEDAVTSHHGSLSRDQRLAAEERLRSGRLKALVATASLELGIDVGHVDLVCQVGSTRSIATLLQRAGRSGHAVGALPKARLFPTTRDELAECAALLACVRRGELDVLRIPPGGLDILAQQLVAEAACGELGEDEAFELARRAFPYRHLTRATFDDVVTMLAEGFTTRRGRRSAHLHRDAVNGRLRGRRGARLAAITSGGAIPDNADFDVVLEPAGTRIGSINEDFAIESIPGDIFQLANTSWRILRVETGRVRVEDAAGQPPTMPFWLGEAPSRSDELSAAVSRLREQVAPLLEPPAGVAGTSASPEAALAAASLLRDETGLDDSAAEQLTSYLAASAAALSVLPTQRRVVLERFFDEAGDTHLVLHSPFGSRINRAWGLALRKRFCRKFNFELQAAATEDSVVLSLGPTHSFPLDEVFAYLHEGTVRDVLAQAVLAAPLFGTRWRWTATRALALLRFRGGRRVPPYLQRMQAEDLLAVVFPDQLACAENLAGKREIPDHPLVTETMRDCLEEAMDTPGLERVLRGIASGSIEVQAVDLREPSPLAAEVLSARPYAFLDDAPLEERRTQAVHARRFVDPSDAARFGMLDPAAILRVREEAWPVAGTPDELHDALLLLGFVTARELADSAWDTLLPPLLAGLRATWLEPAPGTRILVAAERLEQTALAWPGVTPQTMAVVPPRLVGRVSSRAEAVVEILRGRLEGLGPVTATRLAQDSALPESDVHAALLALETEGFVLRGTFESSGAEGEDTEWCERRLLARIHRHALDRLRKEIEPVPTQVFLRFLAAWHGISPAARGEDDPRSDGREGLRAVLERLEGFEAPAGAIEDELIAARMKRYDGEWLDQLCHSGRVAWARLSPPPADARRAGPVRTTPLALVAREDLAAWMRFLPLREEDAGAGSAGARAVRAALASRGASFLADLQGATGLLRAQVEDSLRELVASGEVTCDGFAGLRALLAPAQGSAAHRRPMSRRRADTAASEAGRWSLLPRPEGRAETDVVVRVGATDDAVERIARALLRRHGILFKRLLERESLLPPWRLLLACLHRLEARGEVRGGRFVAGPAGEQFALTEAVGLLRDLRRREPAGHLASVSAADPLNLAGVLTPGARVPALAGHRLLLRDGLPVATLIAGDVTWTNDEIPAAERWEAEKLLRHAGAAPGRAGDAPTGDARALADDGAVTSPETHDDHATRAVR